MMPQGLSPVFASLSQFPSFFPCIDYLSVPFFACNFHSLLLQVDKRKMTEGKPNLSTSLLVIQSLLNLFGL